MLRYAITDRHMFPGDEREQAKALMQQTQRLARAHIDLIQIREKDLPDAALQALAGSVLRAAREASPAKPRLLLNGPARVAAAVRADGVHLRSGSVSVDVERVQAAFAAARLAPPLLSLSCHSLEDVRSAAALDVQYILFGPVFEKRVHGKLVHPGLGTDSLKQAAEIASQRSPPLLLFALGGVTDANAPLCLRAGADGVAGIRLFL